jgi:hypothetical protein
MRFDVVLSMRVFVWASVLAGCTGPPDMTLRKFGLVGTFSDDCSKAIEEGGARAIYETPEEGYPTFTAVNRFGTFQSKIERVDYRVSSDMIIMYVVHPDGAWDEIDIQKEGTGFRTVKMVVHKRNDWSPSLTVDAGRIVGSSVVGSGSDGLLVVKCSD